MKYEFEPGLIDGSEQYVVNRLARLAKLLNADRTWA